MKPPSFETPSRKLTTEEIDQYWSQWKNVFPFEKERFWNALLKGMNNYLTILQGKNVGIYITDIFKYFNMSVKLLTIHCPY